MTARRRFLAQGAALAAVPFISTRTTRGLAAAAKPRLGFALCGLGELSEHQIAPALLKTQRCRLAGLITDSPAKAAAWQKKYEIPSSSVALISAGIPRPRGGSTSMYSSQSVPSGTCWEIQVGLAFSLPPNQYGRNPRTLR